MPGARDRPPSVGGEHQRGVRTLSSATAAELPVTRRQLEVFREYCRSGGHRQLTAARCRLAPDTVRNHLGALYKRLHVTSGLEAAVSLGWLTLPEDRDLEGPTP